MSGHLVHTGVHAWDVLRLWLGEWVAAAAWLSETEAADAAAAARHGASRDDGGTDSAIPPAAQGAPSSATEEAPDRDRGGQAHVVFENGVHAFVSGRLKRFFVFQFDIVLEAGRVRIGNDVDELWKPAPSPRYAGFLELAPCGTVPPVEAARPMLDDLLDAMETGSEPWMSLRHAREALALGVALFQSHIEGHRHVSRSQVRRDLYVASV
jgi:predicted dehydrogenase